MQANERHSILQFIIGEDAKRGDIVRYDINTGTFKPTGEKLPLRDTVNTVNTVANALNTLRTNLQKNGLTPETERSSLRTISIPRDLDEVLAQEPLAKAEMGADYLRYLIRTQEIRETLADMLDHMGETECDGSFFGESQADRVWWAKRTEQLAKDFAALRPEAKAAREVVQPPLS